MRGTPTLRSPWVVCSVTDWIENVRVNQTGIMIREEATRCDADHWVVVVEMVQVGMS